MCMVSSRVLLFRRTTLSANCRQVGTRGPKRMFRQPVSSTNLASVGYDPILRTLEVEFRNGHIYQYESVPPSVVRDLLRAPSIGRFLNQNIKRRYPFRRVQ